MQSGLLERANTTAEGDAAVIAVHGTTTTVQELVIDDAQVAAFFAELPANERAATARRALQIGALCLERANTHADVDFLRKEVEALVHQMRGSVDGFGKDLVGTIGTGEGQVLEPVQVAIQDASKRLDTKMKEVEDLLRDEVDPDRQTSVIGRALGSVRQILDPKHHDSIQSSLTRAVEHATGDKGTLATSVRDVVATVVAPLQKEVQELSRQIREEEAADAAREEVAQKTTLKGIGFEEELTELLAAWAGPAGAELEHCGSDNQPGDILLVVPSLTSPGDADRIIIEAKDRGVAIGRRAVTDALETCLQTRGADAAIYVKRSAEQYAKEIRGYAEGTCQSGRWIATTPDNVVVAVRHLVAMLRIDAMQQAKSDIDVSGAQTGVDRVRAALKKMQEINTQAGRILKSATEIQAVSEEFKKGVLATLNDIENCLRADAGTGNADAGDDAEARQATLSS